MSDDTGNGDFAQEDLSGEQSDAQPGEWDSDFYGGIMPDASLPPHLHNISYNLDLWRRIKAHPIKVAALKRNALSSNPEARELTILVMDAASEREKEVRLYNQSRVFALTLSAAVRAMGNLLNEPLPGIPRSWRSQPLTLGHGPSPATGAAGPSKPGSGIGAGTGGGVRSFIAELLTVKWLALIAAGTLGIATGISQLQIHNYREAIASYKEASAATDHVRRELELVRGGIEAERTQRRDRESELNTQWAVAEANLMEAVKARTAIEAERDALKREVASKVEELRSTQQAESDVIVELRNRVATEEAARAKAERELAVALASSASQSARLEFMDQQVRELREVLETRGRELDQLRTNFQSVSLANERLQTDRTLLSFAESCVNTIKNLASRRQSGGIDKDAIMEAINRYEDAKKNIQRGM